MEIFYEQKRVCVYIVKFKKKRCFDEYIDIFDFAAFIVLVQSIQSKWKNDRIKQGLNERKFPSHSFRLK